jgi:hypothetical protein
VSTATGAFDGTAYRQRVLAVLRKKPSLDLSDPFFIADLPVDVDDEQLIRARLDALVAFWRKEKSPNYKTLSFELARRRPELDAVLLDRTRREQVADEVRASRAAADADRFTALDGLADKLVERFGGVPRSRVPQLEKLASGRGVDAAAFASWMSQHRIMDDGTTGAQPLPAVVRSQLRNSLDELGRLTGDAGRTATLWTFLDVAPSASTAEIAAHHAELHADNQRRQHDRQKTVTSDLLTYVKQHLLGDDRARYAASLVEDTRDRLRDRVAEAVIVDGELTPADFETCVQQAMALGYGLSSEQARAAVRAVATSLGASVKTGLAVDYVLCGSCRTVQSTTTAPDPDAACRYCGTALYHRCPGCGRNAEAAAIACLHCGVSFRAIRAAEESMAAARAALNEGRPAQARTALDGARRAASGVPPLAAALDAMSADIERTLAAARAEWRAVDRDLAERRIYSAIDRLNRLVMTATDVPGPGGTSASGRLGELAARKASVQAEVAAARALREVERESALARVLTVAADCAEALDLLARMPLAPPSEVVATQRPDAIALRWQPSSAPGQVAYRITRIARAGTEVIESRTVGTTSSCEFEDAGVPGGAVVHHRIVATSGRRSSTPLMTDPVLVVRDVTGLTAATREDGIELSWILPVATGAVVVERTVDPDSGFTAPTRRAHAQGSRYHDNDVQPGVGHTYRVYAEYRGADGTLTRTRGQQIAARVTPRPQPVTDLWAVTEFDGRTKLSWATPPSGEVRIFAAGEPLAAQDTDVDLGEIARRGRFVGGGRRRTVDAVASGPVTYTPVTVDGGRAVAGAALSHLTVPPPTELRVTDRGEALLVQFSLPPGVTEAVVLARRDAAPSHSDDPNATSFKVTNTKLEIDGGLEITAAADGAGWFVAVHSTIRDPSGKLLVARTGVCVKAREAVPVRASYEMRRSGLLRRNVVIEITADGPLPDLTLLSKPDGVPENGRDGAVVASIPGGQRSVRVEFGPGQLALPAGLRLFPAGPCDRPLDLTHPADRDLIVD